jgi:RNA polymerase sigma-70 factor (ECF subfamily)
MFEGNHVRTSDAALIRRTAAGDLSAFDTLVRRHQAAVHRLTQALAGPGPEAEEALLEAFLTVRRSAPRWRDDTFPVRAWLLSLARQSLCRRGLVQLAETSSLSELARAAGWGRGGPAAEASDQRVLADAFAALGPADREILILRDLEGLPEEEAAAVIGTSEAVVRARLHRARLRLLGKLREGDADGG